MINARSPGYGPSGVRVRRRLGPSFPDPGRAVGEWSAERHPGFASRSGAGRNGSVNTTEQTGCDRIVALAEAPVRKNPADKESGRCWTVGGKMGACLDLDQAGGNAS